MSTWGSSTVKPTLSVVILFVSSSPIPFVATLLQLFYMVPSLLIRLSMMFHLLSFSPVVFLFLLSTCILLTPPLCSIYTVCHMLSLLMLVAAWFGNWFFETQCIFSHVRKYHLHLSLIVISTCREVKPLVDFFVFTVELADLPVLVCAVSVCLPCVWLHSGVCLCGVLDLHVFLVAVPLELMTTTMVHTLLS